MKNDYSSTHTYTYLPHSQFELNDIPLTRPKS